MNSNLFKTLLGVGALLGPSRCMPRYASLLTCVMNIIICVIFMCMARQWPTGSALLLFLKPRDSLPNGGGVDTDLGGSRPVPLVNPELACRYANS